MLHPLRKKCLRCCACLLLIGGSATAALASDDLCRGIDTEEEALPLVKSEEAPLSRWFFLFGLVNAYPKLEREDLIKQYFDPIWGIIAPGFGGVKTFCDMRDDHLLWPPQIAVGKLINDHLALSFHAGYSAGKRVTRSTDPSILLGLPAHLDFELMRYALYVGFDIDYYPLGAVEMRDYNGLIDRLRAAKPTLGTRVTMTWAGFEAKVKVGFGLFPSLLTIRLEDAWAIPSLNINAGVDIPLNERSVLALNGGYNWFLEERQDFDGPAFTVAWRYFFRQRDQTGPQR